jgi:hypothetical protein
MFDYEVSNMISGEAAFLFNGIYALHLNDYVVQVLVNICTLWDWFCLSVCTLWEGSPELEAPSDPLWHPLWHLL